MHFYLRLTAALGAAGVGLGAFGAHGLNSILVQNDSLSTWNTAMNYYWIHVLAMFALVLSKQELRVIRMSIVVWLLSLILFCGSLIALSLGAPKFFGAITPLGGIGFIAGWLLLLRLASVQNPSQAQAL